MVAMLKKSFFDLVLTLSGHRGFYIFLAGILLSRFFKMF